MKLYYTFDESEVTPGQIRFDAEIRTLECDTLEEGLTLLSKKVDSDMHWIPGGYGDCWMTVREKTLREDMRLGVFDPFEHDELSIQLSGQHPGISGYAWVTPRPRVFVATFKGGSDD